MDRFSKFIYFRVCRAHWRIYVVAAGLTFVGAAPAGAHAIAGQRVFPSTLAFDDPGIGAEFPVVFSHTSVDGVEQNGLDIEIAKPITSSFSLTAGTDYLWANGGGPTAVQGWGNFTLGGVWQMYLSPSTESIGSFGISRTFAHTGSRAVRDDYSTWSMQFNFGQGFGFAHANWLRPFAITGAIGADMPNDSNAPHMLDWDMSLQYSIPYLQNFVKYVGIKAPFSKMIPIIEFPIQTCLDRGCAGQTTGYVNPGVAWIGRYFQLGIEAQIPINHRSGDTIGALFELDFYLDDIAPHGFGAPLFH